MPVSNDQNQCDLDYKTPVPLVDQIAPYCVKNKSVNTKVVHANAYIFKSENT